MRAGISGSFQDCSSICHSRPEIVSARRSAYCMLYLASSMLCHDAIGSEMMSRNTAAPQR
mgnify:CR=1 FL=1